MGKVGEDKAVIVFCLNANSGKEIWRQPFGGEKYSAPQSTPALDGEFVYALNKEGILMYLIAKNGKLHWRKDLVSEFDVVEPYYGFATSPVIAGDLIILTANTSGLALEKQTGNIVWITTVQL